MKEKTSTLVDLNKDFDASVARVIELKADRHVDDIPLNDEYWKALKKHVATFNPNKGVS